MNAPTQPQPAIPDDVVAVAQIYKRLLEVALTRAIELEVENAHLRQQLAAAQPGGPQS